jgi:tetratricopeptide (TPR) repeat protein
LSSTLPSFPRLLALTVGLAVALPAGMFSLRTAVAGWLVEPTPYPAPNAPTEDLGAIRRAAWWAPGEARYPFFEAQVLSRRMRLHWLDEEGPDFGRRAAEASAAATALVGLSPYFHRLEAAIALERARLPGTSAADRELLVNAGVGSLREALALHLASPMLQQIVGLELLSAWPLIDAESRELALECLHKASTGDPGYLGSALSSLWLAVPADQRLAALRRVVPNTSGAHGEASRFLEAALRREGLGEGAGGMRQLAEMRQLAIDEYLAAATVEGLELSLLQSWVDAHARLEPDQHVALRVRAEQLVEQFPDRPEAYVVLARTGALAGNRDRAMAAANRAVELMEGTLGPVRAAALQQRADLHLANGEPQRAADDLEGAARALPDVASIRLRLGRALEAAGRDDEALAAYESAVRAEPRSSGARGELARAYARRFRYLDAIEQWRSVLARSPNAAGPNLEIARLYRAMSVTDRAINYYSRVLEIDPDHRAARSELNALLQGRQRSP